MFVSYKATMYYTSSNNVQKKIFLIIHTAKMTIYLLIHATLALDVCNANTNVIEFFHV